jgi:hypothetical protein
MSSQVQPRVELGALHAEEGLHVAHVGVLREQALHQRCICRHARAMHHEHEVRTGRDAPALLHRGLGHGALLEGLQMLGALAVERDLHQGGEACRQRVRVEQGDAALDDPFVEQAAHTAQRRGRRGVCARCELLVGHGGVGLQEFEYPEVGGVKFHGEIIGLQRHSERLNISCAQSDGDLAHSTLKYE